MAQAEAARWQKQEQERLVQEEELARQRAAEADKNKNNKSLLDNIKSFAVEDI